MTDPRARQLVETYNGRPALGWFERDSQSHTLRLAHRYLQTQRLLRSAGFEDLSAVDILDLGCGQGHFLGELLTWGCSAPRLAGIDARPDALTLARERLGGGVDLRVGLGQELPWPAGSFDVVVLNTVLSSVLRESERREIAIACERVLRRPGYVLLYDLAVPNRANPDVRAVDREELRRLFDGFEFDIKRITLAPPVARRIPQRVMPALYGLLEALPLVRTHHLALLSIRAGSAVTS